MQYIEMVDKVQCSLHSGRVEPSTYISKYMFERFLALSQARRDGLGIIDT